MKMPELRHLCGKVPAQADHKRNETASAVNPHPDRHVKGKPEEKLHRLTVRKAGQPVAVPPVFSVDSAGKPPPFIEYGRL
jgi:hypothetical protein